MRTRRTRLVTLVLLSAACGTASLALPLAAAAQEDTGKVQLRLRLREGDVYKVRVIYSSDLTQMLFGQQQEISQTMEMVNEFAVLEVDADGATRVESAYHSVRFRMDGPFGVVEYDSSDPPAVVPAMAKPYAGLVGQSISARISPDGRVSDIQGVDSLLDHLMMEFELPEGPERSAMEKSLRDQFGDRALEEMWSRMIPVYPDGPVGVGDSWSRRYMVSTGFPMIVDGTFTLGARRDGVAVIQVRSTIAPNPEAPPLEMGSVKLSYDLTGEQSGTMEVDEATGWVIRFEVRQLFSGQPTLEGAGDELQGMFGPSSMEGTMVMETIEEG